MSEELWAAYLATVIDVTLPDGRVRRLEQQAGAAPQDWPFAEDAAWIMTACNPRSVPLAPEVNAARHEELGRQIAALGLTALPNVGFDPLDPAWNEPGYTIPGIDEASVRELALAWEQNAVFGWWPERWEIVGVLLEGRSAHSWRWAGG